MRGSSTSDGRGGYLVTRARLLVAAALAGVVTTVVVSWLAMFVPTGHAWNGPPTDQVLGAAKASDGKFWQLSRGQNRWHTVVGYWHMQISGMSMWMADDDYQGIKVDFAQLPRRDRPDDLTDLQMHAWYHTTGWPFPALSCAVQWKAQLANSINLYHVEGGLQLPRDASFNPRALPLTPVWPGLLANVVVYTGAWILIGRGVCLVRHHRRARRGLCSGCGYPRTDLPVGSPCPECGRSPG
ncbi:MAG: hypothetical protein ACF8R9_06395 [Phycisphaerales bacterium JB054]